MKLRRYVADVFLDVPDAFAAASRIVEEGDVAGITLRIIGTNQTEERTFSGSVLSAQSPSFAVHHGPVEVVEDDSLAILNAHLVHLHHFLGVIFAVAVRLVYDGLFQLRAQHMGRRGFSAGKIFGEGYLRQNLHILYFYHVGDEIRNIIALAQHEDNLQGSL